MPKPRNFVSEEEYRELLLIQEKIQRREITIMDGLIKARDLDNPFFRRSPPVVINTQGFTVNE